ncbi:MULTISPECIES: D-arabinono-1,4-lactone oxidase [unclassified Acinetobacter]|uniref:D-arabinono-1,4-lactone oxidase n=1 Tax=unclassified Acinetobacter TaxID=196816 RepID=UPI0015D20268|nr:MULTISPECIES: D-arabinono-1,4-lactone oxidase [unclassified Acinetobacter]
MTIQHDIAWENWSGAQKSIPKSFIQPKNLEQLMEVVQSQPKIRMVGAGHSFSPLAKITDTLVSLDHLKGILDIDAERCQSTVQAGTRLFDLGEKLASFDQALINQGDIDRQSLAGAIATGTHGTGLELPCLSALVKGFELLTAQGELLQCSAEQNSEIFQAGRVSLGSLGVLTHVQLQNRPMYKLKEQTRLCPLNDVMQNMQQWQYEHRHIEFWAFSHADQVILKTLDETEDNLQPRKEQWLDDDVLLKLCAELTRIFPPLNPWLQKLLGVFVKPSINVDWSSRIFPSARSTKFNEMEYQIPLQHGMNCLEEILHTLRRHKVPMFFPLEYRLVRGDDIWLSPFYQQDSASISVHQFYKQDYQVIFKLVEPIFLKYGGRPHWGKLHSLNARQLQNVYPKWQDFLNIRQELDPQQKWLSPELQQLLIE